MPLVLPTERGKAPDIIEPKRLFIFSHTKVGKTKLAAELPNNLIADLEDGAENYGAMFVNLVKLAVEKYGGDILAAFSEFRAAVVEANTKAGKQVYDFLTIDTSSKLEKMAIALANINYRKSKIGKSFEGDNILTELDYGGGYGWLRDAFTKLYNSCQALPSKSLIILGHVKTASINKNGKELQAKDIDLIGEALPMLNFI